MREKLEEILKENNIDFVLSGKNVSKGNIGICCPFCGDDYTYHLGINPELNVFSCWRDSSHKGTITYLLSVLLNIGVSEAKGMLQDKYSLQTKNDITKKQKELGGKLSIILPDNFRMIEKKQPTINFYNYLLHRGFDSIKDLVDRYDLRCCLSGLWENRIIFPIYIDGKLMTWISRNIGKSSYLRYRDLEIKESVKHAKYCLFDYDNLVGGDKLYICEGVFDAMKINWFTSENISSTCLFTLNVTDEQVKLLLELSSKYKELVLLLDKNAEIQAINLSGKMSFIKNISVEFLPEKFKDAGEMKKEEIDGYIFDRFKLSL